MTTSQPCNRISMLGCGWLGLPLGKALVGQGFDVKGSTTSPDKQEILTNNGIRPFLISFQPSPQGDSLADFLTADLLIINIPPKVEAQGKDFHVQQIQQLVEYLPNSPVRYVIYISSTSVYPDLNREIEESEALPQEGSNLTLLQAERQLWLLQPVIGVTILRCGGLMGYERMPGKYVAGKKGLTTGEIPVNFVHRDDVIAIILEIIRQQQWGQVFNVVAPFHPTRREVYLKNTTEFGLVPPQFAESPPQPFKLISVEKLQQTLLYNFVYPNPLHFYYCQ